jgi:hypothetical protein
MMASKGKGPGLTGFFESKDAAEEEESTASNTRLKGTGKYYHITLRLTQDQWERAHQLARSEGVPLAQMAIRGLSKILEEKGLPKL